MMKKLLYTVPPALLVIALVGLPLQSQGVQSGAFQLEEATIASIHQAIQRGQITCVGLVQAYLARARTYNHTSDRLVTRDGASIPAAPGTMRAGAPLTFPTETVAISTLLPNYSDYAGPPIELGRMEPTSSDPAVQQQYGMTIGTPNSGKVNALGTINLRGERSVTCKGDRDKAPSAGALPGGSPAVCDEFRKQPDALERAAELDRQYGRNPDLAAMPMYCVPFSFKDPFDTKDMRTTAAADARYDIDFPARDHTLVAQLRQKGAIIYAKAVNTEYNGIPGDPGGKNEPNQILLSDQGYQRSSWGGNVANPYDTTRAASLGSSSGSGASVSTNLVTCSICEETSMSCRGPANHNSVALILPHKAMISFLGGAIGADIHNDRAGIHCRSVTDSAKVLDALKDPVNGYYDPRDVFTTVSRASVSATPLAASAATPGTAGSLKGVRIGVIRESMLTFAGVKADEPIAQAAAREIKDVLGARLGATLVESTDPLWPDDPQIENMTTSYTRALAELVPVFFPSLLFRVNNQGQPLFPEVAAAIKPTEFAGGTKFGTGTLAAPDYLVQLADGKVAPPAQLNIRTIQTLAAERQFRFHVAQYLSRRAADWAAKGIHRNAGGLADAQRPFEVLERRAARNLEELGGSGEQRGAGGRTRRRRRAAATARAAAPGRDEGHPGEQTRRRGAAAHVAAAGEDRARRPTGTRRRGDARRHSHGTLRRRDRSADPRGIRPDRLRPDVGVESRQAPLRRDQQQHAVRAARTRAAVLAGLQG